MEEKWVESITRGFTGLIQSNSMAVAESGWMRDLLQGIMERKWRIYRKKKKAVTVYLESGLWFFEAKQRYATFRD